MKKMWFAAKNISIHWGFLKSQPLFRFSENFSKKIDFKNFFWKNFFPRKPKILIKNFLKNFLKKIIIVYMIFCCPRLSGTRKNGFYVENWPRRHLPNIKNFGKNYFFKLKIFSKNFLSKFLTFGEKKFFQKKFFWNQFFSKNFRKIEKAVVILRNPNEC